MSFSEIQYTSFGAKRSLKLSITNCAFVIKYVHKNNTVKISPRTFNSLKIWNAPFVSVRVHILNHLVFDTFDKYNRYKFTINYIHKAKKMQKIRQILFDCS